MADNKPHTIYRLADGTRVPSVTTYLGILNKPALMHWSWQLGIEGLDYRKVRDQAAETGTLVHYLALCDIEGREPDLSDWSDNEIASTAAPMEKYHEWRNGVDLKPILMETPLVSEQYRFGGTPDFYGWYNGVCTLLDFKTSGDVYPENFYQLAAYKKLLEEHGHDVEACRIIRLSKVVDEGFDDRPAGNLDLHWEVFCACQKIHELQKQIRRTGRLVEE